MTPKRAASKQAQHLARQDVAQQAAGILAAHSVRPKALVLDLDYTLWPYWCEMYEQWAEPPPLYPHVEGILDASRAAGIQLAVASRTPTPHVARAFMQKLGLTGRFDSVQLIPAANGWDARTAQKDRAHLPAIRDALGLGWDDMLFFDDEDGNIQKVARLGVASVLVDTRTGLSLDRFQEGLELFAAARGRPAAS